MDKILWNRFTGETYTDEEIELFNTNNAHDTTSAASTDSVVIDIFEGAETAAEVETEVVLLEAETPWVLVLLASALIISF